MVKCKSHKCTVWSTLALIAWDRVSVCHTVLSLSPECWDCSHVPSHPATLTIYECIVQWHYYIHFAMDLSIFFSLKLYTIKQHSHFSSSSLTTMIHHCLHEFDYSEYLTEVGSPYLTSYNSYSTLHNIFKVNPCSSKCPNFLSFKGQTAQCLSIHKQILWLPSHFDYYK